MDTVVVEPLIAAVRQTLVEMAGVDVVVRSIDHCEMPRAMGDVCAAVALKASCEGSLILSFSASAAELVCRRILAEVKQELNAGMIQDCIGEIVNVVAGQAKALLAGTPYHFVFSPPTAGMPDVFRPGDDSTTLVIVFNSDVGYLTLQFCLRR